MNWPIGIRATPAGNEMNVRTIGIRRLKNAVAGPYFWKKWSASSSSCGPDQQVLAVPLEEGPAANRADVVADDRSERVAERRDDDDDPEIPAALRQGLDLRRIADEEARVREDQLRRQRHHGRLDRHREHDPDVADGAVEPVQERDDDLVDESKHRGKIADYPRPRDRATGVVLTGADLTIDEVEAVARHGAVADARRRRASPDGALPRGRRCARRGGRGRLRRDHGRRGDGGPARSTRRTPSGSRRTSSSATPRAWASHSRETWSGRCSLLRANTLALGFSGCAARSSPSDCSTSCASGSIRSCRRRDPSARRGTSRRSRTSALPLIGRGQVELAGHAMPALVALRETGLEPLRLGAKEGLAILNGTQLMSALGALLAADARRLVATASVAAAMSVEALLGTDVAFAEAYQAARPHPGQVAVAAELRHLLRDSGVQQSHHASRAQGPGPVLAALRAAGPRRRPRCARIISKRVLAIEMNAATDNPLIFPDGGVVDGVAARHGRRSGDLGRQLPRRADRARTRLREAGPRRARLDRRAAHRPPPGPTPERAPARPSWAPTRASRRG